MDLENELRQAMAEHVTEVSAPRSLASDAKRRHHRTVRRRTALAVGVAGVAVGVAMVPAYQSFRPQTVGADGQGGGKHGGGVTGSLPATPAPSVTPRSGSPKAGSNGAHPPAKPRHSPSPRGSGLAMAERLLGYLPQGLTAKPCETDHVGSKETTVCRWTGSGGWIEVRLVRGGGLTAPTDLGLTPPMAKQSTVHDHPALRSAGPPIPSQVMWIERHGLGVWVSVSPSLGDRLLRVADGVNVS
ncbi:hypothetical protein [Actinomadura sp. DC4]|uniref:hypothetical protein n=1 Tax=Actinomadura sp. DC4 TaxID=3055069 RepID=UPI0025B13328|nr:hypothetical protein [Actinomadura sp. DC4]MDN3359518.1 hypothetical protein [Actinomadura sp. DC4]